MYAFIRMISRRVVFTAFKMPSSRYSLVIIGPNSIKRFFFASTTPFQRSELTDDNESRIRFGNDISRKPTFEIPQRVRQKVISAADAVSLINDGDTISVSGFVSQGAAEAVLVAIANRYKETGSPNNLTALFGGGPGDWDKRGLNHLALVPPEGSSAPPILRRTIGSHYGQVPMIARLALDEKIEAWTLPLGSVSRMLRAQSTHSPGHITDVGIGTFVDPDFSGGAANESAKNSPLHKELVTKIILGGQEQLLYKALPINVAIIRGTTADGQGNISLEHESLLCDQMTIAAAARNSGGIVIAQVKRLAARDTLPLRSVAIPGPLVDCVVVVDESDHDTLHPMSFEERNNPIFTGEFRTPQDQMPRMTLTWRKIIARRAFFGVKPNTVVNLGIGLPEGVASIAHEEGMLEYITLSTEPGVFGGLPASGRSFGPAYNASALVEMNQMFDYYDGGGLDITFLGAAQISPCGDVNVSRMSKDCLTGPGGFIDISQSTKNIYFLAPLTTRGLVLDIPGDGSLKIVSEGKVKKFVRDVYEKTFSGNEAVKRGQTVFYVTERAVFRRSAAYDTLELVEIAPGVDLQKDVLDNMDFKPVVSPNMKIMDKRIFQPARMNVSSDLFGSLAERYTYHNVDHTVFLELFGINISSEDDIKWFIEGWKCILDPLVQKKGPLDIVVNYDGFDIRKDLEDKWTEALRDLAEVYYKSVQRYVGKAFKRAKLGKQLSIEDWDVDSLFNRFDANKNNLVSIEELREGMMRDFHIHLTSAQLSIIVDGIGGDGEVSLNREAFSAVVMDILKQA